MQNIYMNWLNADVCSQRADPKLEYADVYVEPIYANVLHWFLGNVKQQKDLGALILGTNFLPPNYFILLGPR